MNPSVKEPKPAGSLRQALNDEREAHITTMRELVTVEAERDRLKAELDELKAVDYGWIGQRDL